MRRRKLTKSASARPQATRGDRRRHVALLALLAALGATQLEAAHDATAAPIRLAIDHPQHGSFHQPTRDVDGVHLSPTGMQLTASCVVNNF